jgi:hypothetical protein
MYCDVFVQPSKRKSKQSQKKTRLRASSLMPKLTINVGGEITEIFGAWIDRIIVKQLLDFARDFLQ